MRAFCDNDVYHVEVQDGKFGIHFNKDPEYANSYIITTNIKIWRIRELMTRMLLIYVILFKIDRQKYDIYNFQISYPLLLKRRLIKWLLKKRIVVTEHWSAYRNNFGVTKELPRIKNIFHDTDLRYIFVSDALKNDVEKFSGAKIQSSIVPNIVDTEVFYNTLKTNKSTTYFMVSLWKSPKIPMIVLEALNRLKQEGLTLTMKIAGYGPQVEAMQDFIEKNNMTDQIKLLGQLEEKQIASLMNECIYFVHPSTYETASVVCAEALCCGTPIIVPQVGGIVEYTTKDNSLSPIDNTLESWIEILRKSAKEEHNWDVNNIETVATKRFSKLNVGVLYYDTLLKYSKL